MIDLELENEEVEFEDPILIEGLPGIGNVGKVAVDFLTEELGAQKYGNIYSDTFPNTVFIDEEGLVKLPKVEIYFAKGEERDFLFLTGDIQPPNSKESYSFASEILELVKEMGVSSIVTVGGINFKNREFNEDVYGATTEESKVEELKEIGVRFDTGNSVVIMGMTGLLLGLGERKGMDGFALLAETASKVGTSKSGSRSVLQKLKEYFSFDLDMDRFEEEVEEETEKLSKKEKLQKKLEGMYPEEEDSNYIG